MLFVKSKSDRDAFGVVLGTLLKAEKLRKLNRYLLNEIKNEYQSLFSGLHRRLPRPKLSEY